jgi:hypothetical protein
LDANLKSAKRTILIIEIKQQMKSSIGSEGWRNESGNQEHQLWNVYRPF